MLHIRKLRALKNCTYMENARRRRHILRFGKFSAVSVISSLIDIALFAVFVFFLRPLFPRLYIILSTAAARLLSSLFNFSMNHLLVFKSTQKPQRTALRYFVLVMIQMACSALLVTALCRLLPVNEVLVKFGVDTVLFLISYQVQHRLVFRAG